MKDFSYASSRVHPQLCPKKNLSQPLLTAAGLDLIVDTGLQNL
jgi:hypothetical protein